MRRLSGSRELLDGPLDPTLLAGNLRDLRRVNEWLGGATLSWRALKPFLERSPGRPLRVLDVGTGGADIPRALLRSTDGGFRLEVVATDVRPEIVAVARWTAQSPYFDVRLARPEQIDEPPGSYDVVHSSLLLHHLDPPAAVAMLRQMARVARRAVIVNDLDRTYRWYVLAQVLSRLATRNRYTRHDAPLSVLRAYRPSEVVRMAAAAGLVERARYWTRPAYRYALVLAR